MNYRFMALAVLCIAVVLAAGCTGLSAGNAAKSSSTDGAWQGSAADSISVAREKVAQGAYPVPAATPIPGYGYSGTTGIETRIIKTADISLEVPDVPAAVDSLKSLAAAQGGYLSSTRIQESYNNRLSGTVVIRIPSAGFDAAIAGTKTLGTVKSISTTGEDVTEEYVDLQAQKTSYTNQLAQYNTIMKQSTRVEDIIKVQEQIDRVQTELDRLNGRLNYLNNRIDVSTITVYLQEPAPVGGEAGHDFVAAINQGIDGFFGMIDAVIILIFTLLPLVILGGIGYGAYRWHKGRKPTPPVVSGENEKK